MIKLVIVLVLLGEAACQLLDRCPVLEVLASDPCTRSAAASERFLGEVATLLKACPVLEALTDEPGTRSAALSERFIEPFFVCSRPQYAAFCSLPCPGTCPCAPPCPTICPPPCPNPCSPPCLNPCSPPCLNPCSPPCHNPCHPPCPNQYPPPCQNQCNPPCHNQYNSPCSNPCQDPCSWVETSSVQYGYRPSSTSYSSHSQPCGCSPQYPPPCNPCNPCTPPCNPCNPWTPPCNPCNPCTPPCNPCNPCTPPSPCQPTVLVIQCDRKEPPGPVPPPFPPPYPPPPFPPNPPTPPHNFIRDLLPSTGEEQRERYGSDRSGDKRSKLFASLFSIPGAVADSLLSGEVSV